MQKTSDKTIQITRTFSAVDNKPSVGEEDSIQTLLNQIKTELSDELKAYTKELLDSMYNDISTGISQEINNVVNNTSTNIINKKFITGGGGSYSAGYGINITGNKINTYIDYTKGLDYVAESGTGKQMLAMDVDTDDFQFNATTGKLELVGGGSGTQVRRAITTQASPAQTYITANLYSESTGLEQTSGAESGLSIYCSTMGANLDVCIPRLKDNTDIWVAQFNYDNGGTATARWYMIGQVFQLVNADHLEVDATNGLQTTLFECAS